MAWERNFEAKLWSIREKELEMQKITYLMKMLLTTVGNLIPLLFALASFGHYTVLRHQSLTPSIVFTSVIVFNGIQYAISGLPEAILAAVQCFVSLCRIDQYLDSQEVSLDRNISKHISLCDATITWPGVAHDDSAFKLSNVTVEFPMGELSLICGRVGSGKSLLLLGLLGEADVIDGHVICPHSSPDFIAKSLQKHIAADEWIVSGSCAYVPQTAWLRNQSIRENILFGLPHSVERYMKTLEACALIPDLDIFEYGDLTEIGERGITLSTGQKARISLARAVYSRASILLLDDVLSAVDVHTAHKIYHGCLKGELMHQRTVLLVSHHLQLCVDRSAHVVALEDGKVVFQGPPSAFHRSNTFHGLINSQQQHSEVTEVAKSAQAEVLQPLTTRGPIKLRVGDAPKLVIDEVSSVGRINWDVWKNFLGAYGRTFFWVSFTIGLIVAGLGPVIENSYLRVWADAGEAARPLRYVSIYAGILSLNLTLRVIHSYILYRGSIRSSRVLYQRLLENVLFSSVRYHDTVARGSLLNRFAKDMQIIDGFIADDFGRAMKLGLSTLITFITLAVVGGVLFAVSALILAVIFGVASQDYGHTSRDMRRLVSTTFSPLYSVYDTAITGAIVIRSFGASTAFLRDMMRFVDANSSACHWQWGLNRWFSVLSIAFGGSIVAAVGLAVLLSSTNDASLAGLALVFASTISVELMYFIRAFVGLEQSLVAVERVKATSDLPRDPPEIIDPRPPIGWPTAGMIQCENFSIRYAPDLPNVLHNITFRVEPGQKIGIVGRTGSGKSTLALSFFRFVEASTGRLVIDGLDIATLGLTDLRSGLTIIPQDPTLMSGTLRSNLDTFDEHQDTDIFEALRSVHLLSDNDSSVFANLDSPVSQGGNNFSAGQKQLLCMARALLKHSKVLLIDEVKWFYSYGSISERRWTIGHGEVGNLLS
ncbi:ATP-dependent bile acid permease [Mycena indigotica]|uniref:ATP-dependent bile acid permease n=1 Tax=Mycena indigotica TaxID=2126181 RepID=A0A8H6W5U0_9AGAR|nr:ATP-dependent bile acid permease [Mycena indigotica]KAF7303886.1 ATP-dependent bile acid permease [Mycena indigotica]